MSQSITDAEFATEVLKADLPVLIDFWAPWCGPCKAMTPIMDELATEYAGKLKVVKMNVDENIEIPGQFGVMSIPTFIIFKDGSPVDQFVGSKPKDDVKQKIDAVLAA